MIYRNEPPGLWQYYIKRKDNIGLPIMEVKRKYLAEQLQFDSFMSAQSMAASNAIGTGGPLSRVAEQGGDVAPSFAANVYMKLVAIVKGNPDESQLVFDLVDTEGGLINGKAYYQSQAYSGAYYIRWNGTNSWSIVTGKH